MTTTTSTQSSMMTTSTMPPPMGCEDEADFNACADCFVAENPAGYDAFATALLLACGCDAMAMPAPSCLDECDTMTPADDICPAPGQVNLMAMNMACVMCINGLDNMTEPCLGMMGSFATNCQADPDCVDFIGDLQSCPPA